MTKVFEEFTTLVDSPLIVFENLHADGRHSSSPNAAAIRAERSSN